MNKKSKKSINRNILYFGSLKKHSILKINLSKITPWLEKDIIRVILN